MCSIFVFSSVKHVEINAHNRVSRPVTDCGADGKDGDDVGSGGGGGGGGAAAAAANAGTRFGDDVCDVCDNDDGIKRRYTCNVFDGVGASLLNTLVFTFSLSLASELEVPPPPPPPPMFPLRSNTLRVPRTGLQFLVSPFTASVNEPAGGVCTSRNGDLGRSGDVVPVLHVVVA